MKTKAGKAGYGLATVLGLALIALGGSSQLRGAEKDKGKTVTITGCVTKGESADEFAITQNGKKYGLKSSDVKLAEHLGHKVTVTGVITRGPGEGEEKEKEEEGGGEYADVRVTSLKMISASCQ